MAVQELDRLFSKVIDTQITLAFTVLKSTEAAKSETQDPEAKLIAFLACNAAERFASRLPMAETRSYWNRRLADLRLALAQAWGSTLPQESTDVNKPSRGQKLLH